MESHFVAQVNSLWTKVYPFLARYVLSHFNRSHGDVLELGPFSGGISRELVARASGLHCVIADDQPERFYAVMEQITEPAERARLMTISMPLDRLDFLDDSFDLVVSRGAFFFLTPQLIQAIYRVLRPGGVALLGGGYGPFTPSTVIDEIADESKVLNEALGKRRVSTEDVAAMLEHAGIAGELHQEGGLWITIRKPSREAPDVTDLSLRETLGVRHGDIVSLVGGGGKTTLMFRLAHELQAQGVRVVTTTTTKIYLPWPYQSPCVIVEGDRSRLAGKVRQGLVDHGHVTLAPRLFSQGKIGGTSPDTIPSLMQDVDADILLVEADGAMKLPLKVPADHEPVIADGTTIMVPVVGMDVLGQPLDKRSVFRWERVAELTETNEGDPVTSEMIATVITHRQGLMKGVPQKARVVPFLNKVETRERHEGAREVAHTVLQSKDGQLSTVIMGHLFYHHPVVDMLSAAKEAE